MHCILVNSLAHFFKKVYNIVMRKILREKRKTISISIDRSGDLIIKTPSTIKESEIDKFCEEKSAWIEKQQQRQKKIREFKDSFDFDNFIYIFGEKTHPEQINLTYAISQKLKNFDSIYTDLAQNLIPMAKEKAKQLNFQLGTTKLTKSKHFWGSLDRQKNMKLNYKLVILPQRLIDYVIIHELCHGVELNHSPKFWALVKSYCPDYKKLKKELELYAFLFDE